jgi:hypothetical protein
MLRLQNIDSSTGKNLFKFHNNYADLSENVILPRGSVIQNKIRMIHSKHNYAVGGSYSMYYSGFLVSFGLNGEGTSTHDWGLFPCRAIGYAKESNLTSPAFIDSDYEKGSIWDINIARYSDSAGKTQLSGEVGLSGIAYPGFLEYLRFRDAVYTNPGQYSSSNDYASTSIQTCDVKFFDLPNIKKGEMVTYSLIVNTSSSDGTFTWRVNTTGDNPAATTVDRERGVSFCHIQEIKGPIEATSIGDGVYEYRA